MLMTIAHKMLLDEDGQPEAALIAWPDFVKISESLGLDLDEQEQRELDEALADSRARNHAAFVSADDV